jgi:hypothetical protein
MKYAFGIGSVAMIFRTCFIKTGSANQKLMGGGDSQRQHGGGLRIFSFFLFKNKGNSAKHGLRCSVRVRSCFVCQSPEGGHCEHGNGPWSSMTGRRVATVSFS